MILLLNKLLLKSGPAFLLTLALLPVQASAQKLQCQQLPELFAVFLGNHYAHHTVTDDIKTHTIEQFIKALDPSKVSLLESDVEKLRKDLPPMFRTMNSGNCSQLDDVYKLLIQRAQENEVFVKKTLAAKDYKVDDTVEFVLDPQKRGYPKTQPEREKLLLAMVHFNIANYLLAKPSMEEAKKQLNHRYELATKRISDRKVDELISNYAESFALALDPHSSYLPKDEMEDFQIQMALSLEGIGVSLTSQDGYIVVEEIIPGGSADRAKALKPQDKIIAVSQGGKSSPVSVIDMDLRDVVKLIRGKKGTEVRLTVLRQLDKTENLEVKLVRDKVDIQEQAAKITYETRLVSGKKLKIGILDLPSFYGGREKGSRSSSKDVRDLLVKARAEKIDGLILDLSRNGGGLLDDAVKISGLFMKKGAVVATQDTQKRKDILSDDDPEVVYPGPLILLTSRLSASASEIMAGALKDYHRALIVGSDHTFGKGSVQVLSGLPLDLGAMKVTTGMFFLPKGMSTQHQGVASDVILPSIFSNDEIGEKTLDYSLAPAKIDAFVSNDANTEEPASHWKEVDDSLVKRLAESSRKRVSQDPKFIEMLKEIADMNKNRGTVKLAELRKKSEAEKKKSDDEKKKNNGARKRGVDLESPTLQEAIRIMTDWLVPVQEEPIKTAAQAPSHG